MSETKIKKIKVSGVVHPLADEALEQVVQENSEVTAAALVEHESEINSIDEITAAALSDLHQNKQDILVAGSNIKTINGESVLGSGNIVIEGGSGNIPTKVSELENDAGYTTNTGTITGITMNGASKGTSGVVDLGTVLTAHQNISGKADKASITAGTAGTSSATSGSTLAVPYVTVNTQGIVTGYGTHTHTISGFETTSNKVTSITSSSTNTQYPSAKAVYDLIGQVHKEKLIITLNASGEDYDDDELLGAVVTLTNTANSTVLDTFTWNGSAIETEVIPGISYSISSTYVADYKTPKTKTYTAAVNVTRNVILNYIKGSLDLSTVDIFGNSISQTTANSYVVKDTGEYCLPIVYGNGIKNGATNAAAYTRQGTDYTADFVNHLDNTITDPWIENNTSCTPSSVGLLWQTTKSMISNVTLITKNNHYYLHFTANSIPTNNGLAVLYVKDSSNNTMWSWTIWCTEDDLTNFTLTNHTNVDYTMMGEPFGAIRTNGTQYVLPHYQWGRKDPMIPPAGISTNNNMTVYTINNSTYSGFMTYTRSTVGAVIKSPHCFYKGVNYSKHWNTLSYMNNFWNAAETGLNTLADNQNTAIKTIYDPSPVGYMLPSGRVFTGFTTTGSNSNSTSQFNIIGSFSNGWKFKKNSSDSIGVFVPGLGYRDTENDTAKPTMSASLGYWWTYAPSSNINSYSLTARSTAVWPLQESNKATAACVWATLELN